MATAEKTYITSLLSEGYASVPINVSGADIDPLFQQFREFAAIAWPEREEGESDDAFTKRQAAGQELVEAMHYKIPERPNDADYYMIHRRVGEDTPFSRTAATENKDVLHTGPRTLSTAQERLGKRMPGAMQALLESCVELHEAVKTSVRPVYRELGIEDIMLAEDATNDIHMVRVLRYLGTNATHKADLHFDRAVATMAVWESSPGLVGTPGNNTLARPMTQAELDAMTAKADASPINHVSGEAKFFLGAGYNRLPRDIHDNNGTLPLLAHGVVNQESSEERDAVVVFMNPHLGIEDYVVPSKAETSMTHLRASLES
jgi:hypothetical protein